MKTIDRKVENVLETADNLGLERESINGLIQDKYLKLLNRGYKQMKEDKFFSYELVRKEFNHFWELKEFNKRTGGVKPEFSEKHIQPIYSALVKNDDFQDISELKELTGIIPKFSDRLIKRLYKDYILNVYPDFIESLQDITGVEPVFSGSSVQRAYKKCVRKANFVRLEELKTLTRIEPVFSKEFIQKMYRNFTQDKGILFSASIPLAISSLKKITGVNPEFSEEYIKKIFNFSLNSWGEWRNFDLGEWLQVTGVKPLFSEKLLQKKYSSLAEKNEGIVIKYLSEFTAIRPQIKEEKIQEMYSYYLSERKIGKLEEVIDFFRIKPEVPNSNLLDETLEFYSKDGRVEELVKLGKIFDTKIPKEKYELALKNHLLNRW